MKQPQVGQLYEHIGTKKIVLVTHYCDDRKIAMTKGMTTGTKSGWRSLTAMRHWWAPITQEKK